MSLFSLYLIYLAFNFNKDLTWWWSFLDQACSSFIVRLLWVCAILFIYVYRCSATGFVVTCHP